MAPPARSRKQCIAVWPGNPSSLLASTLACAATQRGSAAAAARSRFWCAALYWLVLRAGRGGRGRKEGAVGGRARQEQALLVGPAGRPPLPRSLRAASSPPPTSLPARHAA